MDGVERGCFDHLLQEQGTIGAADGVVDEGTHGAPPRPPAAASPIRCQKVSCQIPTSVTPVTRPNVVCSGNRFEKKGTDCGGLLLLLLESWLGPSSFPDRAFGSTLY